MTVVISFLKDYPEYITAAANWSYEAWSRYYAQTTRKSLIDEFKQNCNTDRLPLTLIALTGNSQLIGMCSLLANDGVRPDLTPWLASLFVLTSYRKQAIGKKLVDAIKQEAKRLHYANLYLLTVDPSLNNYYAKQDWSLIGTDNLNGHPVSIMKTATALLDSSSLPSHERS